MDRDTGREVFRTVGCLGCHSVASPDLRCELSDFGPDLSRAGDKTSARWLRSWLRSPAAYWAETRMPSMRLSEPEAAAIAAWIAESLRSGKSASPGPPLPPARLLEALAADTGDGVIGPEAGGEAGRAGG
ncbi:MAG: c-type cytochrome, partial [Planctomycetota bacterium]|nr:c-type cytochrome [Planctomycetota bacterium]